MDTTPERKKRTKTKIRPELELSEAKALETLLLTVIDEREEKASKPGVETMRIDDIITDIMSGIVSKIQAELAKLAQP